MTLGLYIRPVACCVQHAIETAMLSISLRVRIRNDEISRKKKPPTNLNGSEHSMHNR